MICHYDPVWKDRADCFIFAREREEDGGELEQLLAKKVAGNTFLICTIPMFIYNLSLGDIVETDNNLEITNVLQRSGRHVIRIKFELDDEISHNKVQEKLFSVGALIEKLTEGYWAIDIANDEDLSKVHAYLFLCFNEGILIFENGSQP